MAASATETNTGRPPTDAEPVDAELLRLFVCRGDRNAMDALLSRHAAAAFRLARRFLRNSADAEDAVQSAFVELLMHAAKYRHGAEVKTWIMSFVVNICRNKSREELHRAERQYVAARRRAEQTAPCRDESERELYQSVLFEIDNLPVHYRAPLWLRYVEGLTSADVAATLKHPPCTVRCHLARGLEQLRARKAYGN
jgi:RNA polymerase sigma-70 factor, ECF subfamily